MELHEALLSSRVAADVAVAVLIKGTLLLSLAWLVTVLLRRRPSAERHAVWTAAFAAALLIPVAGRVLPTRTVHVLDYPRDLTSAALEVPEVAVLLGDGAALATDPRPEAEAAVEAGTPPRQVAVEPPSARLLRTDTTWWDRAQAPLAVGFLALWLAGGLVFAVRLAGDWVRVVAMTLRGRAARQDRPARLAHAEALRQGIHRPLRVIYSETLPVPATWGTLRPTLILPVEAPEWSDERLRAVMVHELAHVRRWDFLSQQISELARVLYWMNPLLWVAFRRAAGERERACDDEVLRSGLRSYEYARVLVDMARRYAGLAQGRRPGLDGGLALARPCTLRERVGEILAQERSRARAHAGVALAACLVLALAAFGMTGVSLLSAEPGTSTLTELVTALDHPDPAVRLKAIRGLGHQCPPAAVEALARVLREEGRAELRLNAAFALGEIGSFTALEPLKAALDDGDPAVRRMALESLGDIDHRWSAEALLPYLDSDDADMRRLALRSLGEMRLQLGWLQPRIVRVLREDPAPDNRALAAIVLGRRGCKDVKDVVDVLEAARGDASPVVRSTVELALARLGVRGVASGA